MTGHIGPPGANAALDAACYDSPLYLLVIITLG